MNILTIENLSIGYGKGAKRRTVGNLLNASLPSASLTALIGANGAGKSTLLRTLAGFIPALEGKIFWKDFPKVQPTQQQLARLLAIVLTTRIESEYLSAREVVESGRAPYTSFDGHLTHRDHEVVDEALTLTQAEHLAPRLLHSLSDGERQRVMIAKALAQETPVILLDEPTAFLDFTGKIGVMRLLQSLAHTQGKTILISTHDLEPALHIADRLWLLSPTAITEGTPRSLAEAGVLDRFFSADGIHFDSRSLRFTF
ncbi:MAG: ABC transporter ATP-binding protein [Bacteroidaceae bacterium]|nr:ABC transporter ATP-binding protein [Bacteroidaceae bacterium]